MKCTRASSSVAGSSQQRGARGSFPVSSVSTVSPGSCWAWIAWLPPWKAVNFSTPFERIFSFMHSPAYFVPLFFFFSSPVVLYIKGALVYSQCNTWEFLKWAESSYIPQLQDNQWKEIDCQVVNHVREFDDISFRGMGSYYLFWILWFLELIFFFLCTCNHLVEQPLPWTRRWQRTGQLCPEHSFCPSLPVLTLGGKCFLYSHSQHSRVAYT